MTVAVCPYCRGPIGAGESFECSGCGTPHHQDCYQENGGCTVFGCSAAPVDEPKVNLSAAELSTTPGDPFPAASPATAVPSATTPVSSKAPPPPLWAAPAPAVLQAPAPRPVLNSILFSTQPLPVSATSATQADFDFAPPDPNAKNRTTFILLGTLLGAVGAHNFYAGYRRKAIAQVCISVFTLGVASPMTWVWALIDVFTVDRDANGIRFRA
jgi:TM2 domain-containing membrane protein YozV